MVHGLGLCMMLTLLVIVSLGRPEAARFDGRIAAVSGDPNSLGISENQIIGRLSTEVAHHRDAVDAAA